MIKASEKFGGQGSNPVNSIKRFFSSDNVLNIGPDIWYRSGVIDTNVNQFPDATKILVGNFVANGFDLSTQDTSPKGICWDGTYYWVVGDANNTVYRYNANGTYSGFSFSVGAQTTQPSDITQDGTNLIVQAFGGNAYKYQKDGTYTEFNFNSNNGGGSTLQVRGIVWYDGFYYVVGQQFGKVDRFDVTGSFVDSFDLTGTFVGTPYALEHDGSKFWLATRSQAIYPYNNDFTVVENSFIDTSLEGSALSGVCWDGVNLVTVDDSQDFTYKYESTEAVGTQTSWVDSDSGQPLYIRVK